MKYMHFRASCAYTALAMLMEHLGADTEDRSIALEMKLPWLFAKEDGVFAAGPMLQGAKWFDLWLNPRGYRMSEVMLEPDALPAYLREHCPVMLGLRTPGGKHAVVFERYDGAYHFLNPVHKGSGEPTSLSLGADELCERADRPTVVGEVLPAAPRQPDMPSLLAASASTLRENLAAIEVFSAQAHAPEDYAAARDGLFRSLLLDGIAMLELIGETELAQGFSALQGSFLSFLRGSMDMPLASEFPMDKLRELTEAYLRLIEREAAASCPVLYHGSVVGGLDVVLANAKSHLDGGKAAYFTSDRVYALVCCRSREENFVTMGLREDGRQHYFERFPNQLRVMYEGKEGFLYRPAAEVPLRQSKGHSWESQTDVPVSLCEHVRDVYEAILREEEAGNIAIHRYAEIDPAEQRLHADHIRDDLDNPVNAAYRDFLFRHFSPLWD